MRSTGSIQGPERVERLLRSYVRVDSMVWHHDSLQYILGFIGILRPSGHGNSGIDGADLCELANSKVSKALFEEVPF